MIAYSIANQVALFIVIALANKFEGGVAMYLVAWSFFQLPNGLIANSIMTTTIPKITYTLETKEDDINDFSINDKTREVTKQASTGLIIMMGIVSALGISVAIPAVTLLIGRGNISVEQAELTGKVLIAFLAFLPAFSLYLYCVRLGNSFNLTKQLFYINVFQNLANIVLAIILVERFEITGLAFAFSFSYLLLIPFSIFVIQKSLGALLFSRKVVSVMMATCILAAFIGYIFSQNLSSLYLSAIAGAFSCLLVLAIGSLFVKSDLKDLAGTIYKRNTTKA
jgi:putative peptidoglycan lipid II flippase